MPKIIAGLNEAILQAAVELFGEHGYDAVDLKMIASRSGIAVGTIYNYYPNKQELFLRALRTSCYKIIARIDQACVAEVAPGDRLDMALAALAEGISEIRSLGRTVFSLSEDGACGAHAKAEAREIWNALVQKLAALVGSAASRDAQRSGVRLCTPACTPSCAPSADETRFAETLLASALVLHDSHPKEEHDNALFISLLADAFIRSHINGKRGRTE